MGAKILANATEWEKGKAGQACGLSLVEEMLSTIPILTEISSMSRWLDIFGRLAALGGGDG